MAALAKLATATTLVAAVPALAATAAVPLRLWAPPPPQGYAYAPLTSAALFTDWDPLFVAPRTFSTVSQPVGTQYVPVATYANQQLPAGAAPVYKQVPDGLGGFTQQLIGYTVPVFGLANVYNDPQWYSPIPGMSYFTFFGATLAPNGYPLGPVDAVYTGEADIPCDTGLQHVVRLFRKQADGRLVVEGSVTNPPYCVTKPVYGVLALIAYPGRPAVPATPPVTSVDDRAGWNSGANSIAAVDGDLHTVFQVNVTGAGVVGLATGRADVTRYDNISHAFYFDSNPATGALQYAIMESGRRVSPPASYVASDAFEIVRSGAGGVVTYKKNGTALYTSPTPLYGPLIVGNAMYRAQDGVL